MYIICIQVYNIFFVCSRDKASFRSLSAESESNPKVLLNK